MPAPGLRPATLDDVEAILALQESTRLVSGFTHADYAEFVKRADHFYVLEAEGRIAAFVLGYSSERIGKAEVVNGRIRERVDRPFVLIKQVAVTRSHARRGLARRLYDRVRVEAAERPRYAAIVLDPPNEASVAFHERLGFRKAFELDAPDGSRRGIWTAPPRR